MKLEPGPGNRAIREAVREFAQSTVRAHAEDVDRRHRFPQESIAGAAALDLLGMLVPAAYGGANLDHLDFTICVEELALSDGAQSMYPAQFDRLMAELRIIAPAIGRGICLEPVTRRGWGS